MAKKTAKKPKKKTVAKKRYRPMTEAESVALGMRLHAESQARWLEDFGDRPVVDYDTGRDLGTAREYLGRRK